MLGFAHTVTVQRAAKLVDGSGQPVEQRDWDHAVDYVVSGLNVQPRRNTQRLANDTRQVSTVWRLLSPPGRGDVDIQVGDQVLFGGRTLQVVAEPQRWPNLRGGIDHIEVDLQDDPPTPGTGGSTTRTDLGDRLTGVGAGWRI